MVSCSGAVLCLCFPLPFVDQHGTAVHLFMIYFTQWLGPDYTDRHSRLFEGQLDLCNDTQTVLKSWEYFQPKKGQWKNSTRTSPRRAFLSLIPGRNINLFFYLEFFCNYQCPSDPQKLKRRRENETWAFLMFKDAYWRRDYKEQHSIWETASFMVSFSKDLNHRVRGTVQICTSPGSAAIWGALPQVWSPSALTESLALWTTLEWGGKKKHNSKSCRMKSQGQQWENTEFICNLNKVISSMF